MSKEDMMLVLGSICDLCDTGIATPTDTVSWYVLIKESAQNVMEQLDKLEVVA